MIKPVDATTTAAWDELDELADNAELDLRRAFADDPERAARFTHTVGDLHVDLSKNLINDDVIAALLRYATPWIDKLGATGVGAIVRIMGFLILVIGVELIIHGIRSLQLF